MSETPARYSTGDPGDETNGARLARLTRQWAADIEAKARYIGCGTEGITAPCWQCGAPMAQSGPEMCEKCSYVNWPIGRHAAAVQPTREELVAAVREYAEAEHEWRHEAVLGGRFMAACLTLRALAARLPGGG